MRPIWFFVGLLLVVDGSLVTIADIIYTMNPPDHMTVLAHLRPGLWWGVMMVIAGIVFLVANRRTVIDH